VAGHPGTPLERKLGIKPDDVVLLDGAPAGFDLEAPTTRRLPQQVDLTLTFHTHRASLERRLPRLQERTSRDGMIWVCWPKRAAWSRLRSTTEAGSTTKAGSTVTPADLDDNTVREIGLATGWVDVKVCAIDETWSALKLVRRLADRC
jgi:hypothetical protein